MNHRHLHQLLQSLQSGQLSVGDAIERLCLMPYEDIDFARIDHHRALRTGFPEVVYGRSKTPAQVAAIMQRLVAVNDVVLCTRASRHAFEAVVQVVPHAMYYNSAEGRMRRSISTQVCLRCLSLHLQRRLRQFVTPGDTREWDL